MYKKQKLLHPEFQSEFETKAVFVFKKLGCKQNFCLLLLKKENAELARVELAKVKEKTLLRISELSTHALNDLPELSEPVFVFSAVPVSDSLQDALTQKMPSATFHASQVPFNGNSTKGIIMVNHAMIGKHTIATSVGELSLLDFLFKKEDQLIPLTVPLDEATLASPFCGSLTWADALPSADAYDREVCGVKCTTLRMRTVIDAYQNIFLSIRDNFGNGKVVCLYDAFYEPEPQRKPAIKTNTVTKPKPEPESAGTNSVSSFIIDTNAFIYEPDLVKHLKDGVLLYLSYKVVDELDGLKENKDTQKSAKLALKCLSSAGDCIQFAKPGTHLLPKDLNPNSPDNRIISCALKLLKENVAVALVTDDNGMTLKARGLKVPVLSLNQFKELSYK